MDDKKQKADIVADVMTKEVVSANSETSIIEIADLMFKNKFHAIPIVDDGELKGIVTERDFFIKGSTAIFLPSYISFLKENKILDDLSEDRRQEINTLINSKVKEIMTKPCVTILPQMKIKDLLGFFRTTNLISLPVVDEKGKMVGIVTLTDIIGLLNA